MDSFLVHTSPHRGLGGKDSDLLVSSLDNRLGSGNGHSEDMSPDEYLLLEPPERVDTRCIAGENDDIRSLSEERFYSDLRKNLDFFTIFRAIRCIRSIHREDHIECWVLSLECLHDDLPSESRIEESNCWFLVHRKIGEISPIV